jgi:hypothetical protein
VADTPQKLRARAGRGSGGERARRGGGVGRAARVCGRGALDWGGKGARSLTGGSTRPWAVLAIAGRWVRPVKEK